MGLGADEDLAMQHLCLMHDQAGDRRLHIGDLHPGTVAQLDHPLVGELPTTLGVEGVRSSTSSISSPSPRPISIRHR